MKQHDLFEKGNEVMLHTFDANDCIQCVFFRPDSKEIMISGIEYGAFRLLMPDHIPLPLMQERQWYRIQNMFEIFIELQEVQHWIRESPWGKNRFGKKHKR